LADGTVELVNGALIIPKFNDAQESRKTNAQAKREQREKAKATARTTQTPIVITPHRQTAADAVQSAADGDRSSHPPSPALPCPALPERIPPRQVASPDKHPPKKNSHDEPPTDPRHAPMVKALCEAFERVIGAKYAFGSATDKSVGGRNAKAVTSLLGMGVEPTVLAAWERALREQGFPKVRTLPELVKNFDHFTGKAGPMTPLEKMRDAGRPREHQVGELDWNTGKVINR
jgi:hypothetical protein